MADMNDKERFESILAEIEKDRDNIQDYSCSTLGDGTESVRSILDDIYHNGYVDVISQISKASSETLDELFEMLQ